MIVSTTRTEHMLEIFGPRRQAWRSVQVLGSSLMHEPVQIAQNGRFLEAITLAEDIWIAKNGDMHGISFRVSTKSSTISARSVKDLTDEPVDRDA